MSEKNAILSARVGAVDVRIGISVSAADMPQADVVLAVLRGYIGDLLSRADGIIEQRRKGA